MWEWQSFQEIADSGDDIELYHHGILGMKWGIRRYQNEDGSLTPAGRRRILKHPEKFTDEQIANEKKRLDNERQLVNTARDIRRTQNEIQESERSFASRFIRDKMSKFMSDATNKVIEKTVNKIGEELFKKEDFIVDLNSIDLNKPISADDMKKYGEFAKNALSVETAKSKLTPTEKPTESKPEAKPAESKPESKPEVKPEPKPEPKPEVTPARGVTGSAWIKKPFESKASGSATRDPELDAYNKAELKKQAERASAEAYAKRVISPGANGTTSAIDGKKSVSDFVDTAFYDMFVDPRRTK